MWARNVGENVSEYVGEGLKLFASIIITIAIAIVIIVTVIIVTVIIVTITVIIIIVSQSIQYVPRIIIPWFHTSQEE
jgi:hypothetical protein